MTKSGNIQDFFREQVAALCGGSQGVAYSQLKTKLGSEVENK